MQRTHSNSGFTLIEMMVALSISVLAVGSVTVAATNFARTYVASMDKLETQQNLRIASETLFRDLRTAGYGLHEIANPINDWVPGSTNWVTVVQGATTSTPDQLRILGAEAQPNGELLFAASAGSTVLTLRSNGAARFNTSNRDLVVIGRLETARILSISGDNVTISTDPNSAGAGLQYGHAANSPVELVTVTTYQCITTNLTQSAGQPYLVRFQNSASAPAPPISAMVALGIENFQVSLASNDVITLNLTSKVRRPAHNYVHPATGDHYRRFELQASMQSMN